MRSLLIALILGITALMFYSALWFKSESIEADITARTTDNLTSIGANDIEIDVDGRHVTLSGVVYDEATENEYLDVADATYGALGPIDGLTLQADGGYVSAIKTADGIALRGTVPSDEARAILVAEAESATDGAVDDQLIVAGPTAAWQDEATFGVGQLAGLTAGTLTVAAGSYVLSGNTDDDPAVVADAVSTRDGWNAFISSPIEEQGLAAEVNRLSAEVTAGEGRIDTLEATIAGLQADTSTLSAERDAISAELANLTARMPEVEADAAELQNQLDAANTMIGDKEQVITDLSGQLADSQAQIATLETELSNRQIALGNTDEQVLALTGELESANGTIADLSAVVAARDTTIAELTGQVAGKDAIGVELADLKASLSEGEANTADLRSQLTVANTTIGEKDQIIADLTGQLADGTTQIASLETEMANREAALTADLDAANGTIADLSSQVAERDTTIESLNAQVAGLTANADQSVAELSEKLATRDGTISELTAAVSDRDQQIATLTGAIADRDAAIDDLNAQVSNLDGLGESTAARIAALTAAAQASNGDITALEGKVADLTEVVAARDETIAALQARTVSVSNSAEQCAAQATGVLEGAKINFETASARIAGDSVVLLERLTGIALACVGDGLSVEIGGHTDAQGSTDDNQALSEARAQAVLAFMVARGVPADGLEAVGFGEIAPIATNDTAAGRAQNRRISFDWQAR